jgi:hypothetical protein
VSTFRYKFDSGIGLGVTPADKTQTGALEFTNVDLSVDDVVQKRPGADLIALSTTTSPGTELPSDELTELWYRDAELCLGTRTRLYSRRECAGAGSTEQGTATPAEIQQALDLLDDKLLETYDVGLTFAPVPVTATAVDRLDRYAEAQTPRVFNDGTYTTTATMVVTGDSVRIDWSTTGPAVGGSFPLFAGWSKPLFYVVAGVPDRGVFAGIQASSVPGQSNGSWYNAIMLPNGALTLQINDRAPVQGSTDGAAFSATPNGVYYLRPGSSGELAFETWRPDDESVRSYPLDSGEADVLLNTGQLVFDAEYSSLLDGPNMMVAPVDGGNLNLFTYDFPQNPPAGATASVSIDAVQVWANTDQLGVAYDGADLVTAVETETGSSRYTLRTVDQEFNSAEFGTVDFRVAIDRSSAIRTAYVLNGSREVLIDLQSDLVLDLRVASYPDGRSLIGSLGNTGDLTAWTYEAVGQFFLTERTTDAGIAAFDVAVDTVIPTWAIGRVTSDSVVVEFTQDLTGFTPATSPRPVLDVASGGNSLAISVRDVGPNNRARCALYVNDPLSTAYRTCCTFALTDSGVTSQSRIDSLSSIGPSGAVSALVEVGAFPRALVAYEAVGPSAREVYEVDSDLFVRVVPATVSLDGGDWSDRGAWTRCKLRTTLAADFGARTLRQMGTVAVRSPATGEPCFLSLLEFTDGLDVIIYTTHVESGAPTRLTVDPLGARPRTAACDVDRVLLTYVSTVANKIQFQFWAPGQNFAFTDLTLVLGAELTYDADAGVVADGRRYGVWIAVGVATTIRYRYDNAVVIDYLIDAVFDAVATYAIPDAQLAEPRALAATANDTPAGPTVTVYLVDVVAGVAGITWSRNFVAGTAGDAVKAITVSGLLADYEQRAEVAIEVERAGERVTEFWEVTASSETLIHTLRRCSVYGSMTELRATLVTPVSSVDATLFGVAQRRDLRSGILGFCAQSQEFVFRTGVGGAETLTDRLNYREVVSRFNRYQLEFVLGYPIVTEYADPSAAKYCVVDVSKKPNRPAVTRSLSVSAHAGYPRAYDGVSPFEQDWHELPQIVNVSQAVGGLDKGDYGVAVTYEAIDGRQLLYRSAPAFEQVTLIGGTNIRVDVRPLSRSERRAVNVVVWRTLVNGTVYYRATQQDALQDQDRLVISLDIPDDAIRENEILDQVLGGVVFSQPASITDWLAEADGRLWSRSPERGYLARFTTPATEGRAPHWNLGLGTEAEGSRDVVSLADMDGRLVLLTTDGAQVFGGGGPTATGIGSYVRPQRIPSESGAIDHNTVTLMPEGLFFAGLGGPRLLTRGLSIYDIAEPLSASYDVDGEQVSTAVYVFQTSTVVISNGPSGRLFRYHIRTRRFAEDTGRPTIDVGLSQDGTVTYLLSDGRVLRELPVPNRDAPRTDGGVSYQMVLSTPWLHEPAETTHSGFNVHGFTVFGQRLGSHELVVEVYYDYATEPARIFEVPAATSDSRASDGQPYIYTVRFDGQGCFCCRIRVRDAGEPRATFRLEVVEVHWSADGSADEYQFPDGFYFSEVT